MTTTATHVIVGAGLAGAKAAETLRSEGFEGRILLLGAEVERPYERPPLSKGYLAGSKSRESVFVHESGWYDEHDVELRIDATVVALHPERHEVVLADGERLHFDKALLTTGSAPRRVAVPGSELAGVRYLRSIADADALVGDLSGGGRRVVVIGGGWIGLEVAAAARGYGNEVTVIEPQPTVLRTALGDELGSMFANLHRDHGVHLLLGDSLHSVQGSAGNVASVQTSAGLIVPADVIVVGVGAVPNIGLAADAGLSIDNGVVADERLSTSHPDIYAAGDVANSFRPSLGRHLRVEHWANALHGGPAAARSMLGESEPFDPVPYFFTDQYDLGMEYSGAIGPDGYDQVVYRGDQGAGAFIAFWLKDGRVLAGMNVNVWDVAPAIQALVRSSQVVDLNRLADPGLPLEEVLADVG